MKSGFEWHSHIWLVVLAAIFFCGTEPMPGFAPQKSMNGLIISQPSEPSWQQADQERGALDRFLDAHPEIQRDVVSSPSQIADASYVHDHPELKAFLEAHPLVKADPRAFISPQIWRLQNRRSDTDDILGFFVPFAVFVCCLLAVLWVLKLILENRRWNKSFKVHEEVHTKLIEKFSSGQELTAYMESDAGRRLLEWTPPVSGPEAQRLPMAVSRILWSLQTGLVFGLVGAGLLLIRNSVPNGVEPLLVFGTLGLTIGIGFVVSAVISYGLSKHQRLMEAEVHGGLPSGR